MPYVHLRRLEKTLGQRLRELRGKTSQADLAVAAGLTAKEANMYPKWERDEVKKPNVSLFRKLDHYHKLPERTIELWAFQTWGQQETIGRVWAETQRESTNEAPEPEIAEVVGIKNRPGLPRLIEELDAIDPEQFDDAAEALRRIRSGEDVSSNLDRLSATIARFLNSRGRPASQEEIDASTEQFLAFWTDTERQR